MIVFIIALLMFFPVSTANDYYFSDDSEPEWISWEVNQVNPYKDTVIIYQGKCNCECE